MCAIGRALRARPRLLMLDEPSLGLAPVMVRTIFEILARINREGMTILLVEQNVLRSLQLSHRGYVIANGRITIEAPGADPRAPQRPALASRQSPRLRDRERPHHHRGLRRRPAR